MKIKKQYLKKIAGWLLPYTCIFCRSASPQQRDLCEKCEKDLPLLANACPRCAVPMPENQPSLTCGFCLKQAPPFETAHALFFYRPPIPELILALKFRHSLANAKLLGELLTEKIKTEWYQNKPLPSTIIPVPLHPKRLQERGFNQALEIARPIAHALKIPINHQTKRIKATEAQATLSISEREKNIRNAFSTTENFSGQHIAVIDDVMTTGYTMKELSNTLKRQGADIIDVWCCARPFLS